MTAANPMPFPLNLSGGCTTHGGGKETAVKAPPQGDRRKRTRAPLHWPLILVFQGGGETIETVTENLSSSGFYCLSPKPLLPGETVVCTLKAPTYDPKGDRRTISLECKAVALRSETAVDGLFGIACRIEDYHLVPQARQTAAKAG